MTQRVETLARAPMAKPARTEINAKDHTVTAPVGRSAKAENTIPIRYDKTPMP